MRYGLSRRFAILALIDLSVGASLLVLIWLGAAGADLATSYSKGLAVVVIWVPTVALAWLLGTLAILTAWRPLLVIPFFVLSCLALAGAGFLLLELRNDDELFGAVVVGAVTCIGLLLGGWFISKAGWPPALTEE